VNSVAVDAKQGEFAWARERCGCLVSRRDCNACVSVGRFQKGEWVSLLTRARGEGWANSVQPCSRLISFLSYIIFFMLRKQGTKKA